jgi:hypothetical protein
MHDGRFDALADVVELYRRNADLARAGRCAARRPSSAESPSPARTSRRWSPFLKSLNVDYQ